MHKDPDFQSVDPICGMCVDPATAAGQALTMDGFIFCSSSCLQKFQACSARFASPAAELATQHGEGEHPHVPPRYAQTRRRQRSGTKPETRYAAFIRDRQLGAVEAAQAGTLKAS